MNKKQFLNTYKKISEMDEKQSQNPETSSIYRSKYDEHLIKEYHYAKFQKNFHNIQQSKNLKSLLEKEEWDDKDTEQLLKSLR